MSTNNNSQQRTTWYREMSRAYCKLLNSIDWNDRLLVAGIKEGLRKFLSNAFIELGGRKKYFLGDFYSKEAKQKIEAGDFRNLVFEHMVPKTEYIQNECMKLAKEGNLTEQKVFDLLNSYWKIAIITKSEDKKLSKSMPKEWDRISVNVRYTEIPDLVEWVPNLSRQR